MLTLNNLPWRNLKGYAGRTTALILFAALMAMAVFGGTIMISGVRKGLDSVRSRLGADIMVTPANAENEFDAQTVLIQAEPGYFYMDAGKLQEIRQVDGVEIASPQLFLASARAGCCSTRVQMIAFDPETDFTIQPWIRDTGIIQKMALLDVVIGSTVNWASVAEDNVIRFYDTDCHVIGQFAPTGSTLDSAVYMTFDSCKALIQACRDKGLFRYRDLDADQVISSVMVRVKEGYEIEKVAEEIRKQVPDISVATATRMVSGISESLNRISTAVFLLIAVLWGIGLIMTVLIFTLLINERRREFASLRMMGAGRSMVSGIVEKEALTVNLAGGLMGIAVTAVIIFSFSTLIGQSLGVGFVPPSVGQAALSAGLALISVLFAAALAVWITVRKLNRMDISLVLREGE